MPRPKRRTNLALLRLAQKHLNDAVAVLEFSHQDDTEEQCGEITLACDDLSKTAGMLSHLINRERLRAQRQRKK